MSKIGEAGFTPPPLYIDSMKGMMVKMDRRKGFTTVNLLFTMGFLVMLGAMVALMYGEQIKITEKRVLPTMLSDLQVVKMTEKFHYDARGTYTANIGELAAFGLKSLTPGNFAQVEALTDIRKDYKAKITSKEIRKVVEYNSTTDATSIK